MLFAPQVKGQFGFRANSRHQTAGAVRNQRQFQFPEAAGLQREDVCVTSRAAGEELK